MEAVFPVMTVIIPPITSKTFKGIMVHVKRRKLLCAINATFMKQTPNSTYRDMRILISLNAYYVSLHFKIKKN